MKTDSAQRFYDSLAKWAGGLPPHAVALFGRWLLIYLLVGGLCFYIRSRGNQSGFIAGLLTLFGVLCVLTVPLSLGVLGKHERAWLIAFSTFCMATGPIGIGALIVPVRWAQITVAFIIYFLEILSFATNS